MALINARAAFEKVVKEKIDDLNVGLAASAKIVMIYDNVLFAIPSKKKKYVAMSMTFSRSTLQVHGAASDFYSGTLQCNVYVPKNDGTATLSEIGEKIIDGITSVNASSYSDPFNCKPRASEVAGPIPVELEDNSHFMGIISCQFSANA
jgi:hypothetical protein